MKKRMAIMLSAMLLLFGAIFGFKWFQGKMMADYFASFSPPPVTVSAVYARQEQVNPYLSSIGTLRARYGTDISAEVEGVVSAIKFVSGQEVEQGQLLLELDDSVEQANLKSFQARLKLTTLNHKRDQQLVAKKLVSQDQYDRSLAEYEEAVAQVEQTRANIAKKKIKAPFKGRMGILQVDPGQYVSAGAVIATLQSLETLLLDFSLPEQYLSDVFVDQAVRFEVDAYSQRVFDAHVFAIDSRIDRDTRTLQLRARVDNTQRLLVPGMFASITLVLEPAEQVVLLPVTAVNYSLYGEEVFIIESVQDEAGNSRQQVNRKNVVTGQRLNEDVVIVEGVETGQLVAVDGQLKLGNGTEVALANEAALKAGATQ